MSLSVDIDVDSSVFCCCNRFVFLESAAQPKDEPVCGGPGIPQGDG